MRILEAVLPIIAVPLLGLVTSGVLWLIRQGGILLKARTADAHLTAMIDTGAHLAELAVQRLENQVRPTMPEIAGKLSVEGMQMLRNAAITSLKGTLTEHGSSAAKTILSNGDLYLVSLIENAVAKMNGEKAKTVALKSALTQVQAALKIAGIQ